MWARVVNRVSLLGLLLNPQVILGYTHPRIQDRLMLLAKSQEQQLIKNATGHKIKESHPLPDLPHWEPAAAKRKEL